MGLRVTHLTVEASNTLKTCRTVLYTSYVPETANLLRDHCSSVVDLSALYEPGLDRLTTYKRMAGAALDAALETPPVALVLYGHPLVLSLPSMICMRVGPMLGLRVSALPAVSALDTLMADLGVDPVTSGVQMHEATDLLLYRRPIVPGIATVLWQVGTLGTRLHTENVVNRPERLNDLTRYLLTFFPAEHPTFLVASSVTAEPPQIRQIPLAELPGNSPEIDVAMTLYLPPLGPATVDDAVADHLSSQAYLDSVTIAEGAG
jgi:uncharacterized protein YabN with tetrapyrrole methylase and pyrophosphatase domain